MGSCILLVTLKRDAEVAEASEVRTLRFALSTIWIMTCTLAVSLASVSFCQMILATVRSRSVSKMKTKTRLEGCSEPSMESRCSSNLELHNRLRVSKQTDYMPLMLY